MPDFKLVAPFEPTGDQPAAIEALADGIAKGTANAERLRVTEGVVPVEASGQGRIEFEIVP